MTMTMRTLLSMAVCVCVSRAQRFVGFTDVAPMPVARSDMTATVVPDPSSPSTLRVYIAGGCTGGQICSSGQRAAFCQCVGLTNATDYFIPAQNRWVTTSASAPVARHRHAAAAVNGTLYLFGGRAIDEAVITAVDAYDVAANQWRNWTCEWTAAVSDHTAFVDGTRIFLTGGYAPDYSSAIAALTEFDPETCTFTAKTPMAVGRGDVSSVTAGGLHFVVGGTSTDFCNPDTAVQSYNSSTDMWTSRSNLTVGRNDAALGTIEGQVLVIGGETVNAACDVSVPIDDVESLASGYTGVWVAEDSVPSNRFRFAAATVGGSVYLFGGQGDYIPRIDGVNGGFPLHNDVMRYAPATYTDFEATQLLNVQAANISSLGARVTAVQGTVSSRDQALDGLLAQIANMTAVLGSIDRACFASSGRSRRENRCPAAAGGDEDSSSEINKPVAIGVGVAVLVMLIVGAGAFVWLRSRQAIVYKMADPVPNAAFTPPMATVLITSDV